MADTITIRAEMIDDVSGPAEKIRSEVKSLGESVKTTTTAAGDGAAKSIESIGTSARSASTEVTNTGRTIEDMHAKSRTAASGGVGELTKGLKGMSEESNKLVDHVNRLGDSIENHLRYPLRSVYYSVEALTVGMVALGFATANSMAVSANAITAYTGSTTLAVAATKQLYALSGPESLGSLTSQYGALVNSGMSPTQAMAWVKSGANWSGQTGTGAAGGTAFTGAIADISTRFGYASTTDLKTLLSMGGVGLANIVEGPYGLTGSAAQHALSQQIAMGAGQPLSQTQLAQIQAMFPGGAQAALNTPAGALDSIKKGISGAIEGVMQPLFKPLAQWGDTMDKWGQAVQNTASGTGAGSLAAISKDWNSGNTKDLGNNLAILLQAKPNTPLAQFLGMVATDAKDIGTILTQSVVPALKDASPVLKIISDILGFMADHTTLVKDGLIGFAAVITAGKFLSALLAFEKFLAALKDSSIIGSVAKLAGMCLTCSGGAGGTAAKEGETAAGDLGKAGEGAGAVGILGKIKSWLKIGGRGGAAAEGEQLTIPGLEAAGATAGGVTAGTIAGAAALVVGSMLTSNWLEGYAKKHPNSPMGMAARVGSFGLDPYLDLQKGVLHSGVTKDLEHWGGTAWRDTGGAVGATGRAVGSAAGAAEHWLYHGNLGKDVSTAASDVGHFFGGLFGGHHARMTADPATKPITITGGVNITISGSGDPKRVANEIPKALGSQIDAHVAMKQRRGAPSTPPPTPPILIQHGTSAA